MRQADLFPVTRGATFSDCDTYRYELWRRWGPGALLPWVMLNPSTANSEVDDPTVRRVINFSRRWGYPGCSVVNLFALRATNPSALKDVQDPVGPHNNKAITDACTMSAVTAGIIVVAWGRVESRLRRERVQEVLGLLKGSTLKCLGTIKGGHPRHPLYTRKDTELAFYKP